MMGAFDGMIARYGAPCAVYAPDGVTVTVRETKAMIENVRTMDMLGRAQADLFHLYFPTGLPVQLDTGDLPRVQRGDMFYVVAKPLVQAWETADFLDVGQAMTCLRMPLRATLKQLARLPTPPERNAMDEPLDPALAAAVRVTTLPVALENDFEPVLLSNTQRTTLPAGVMTLYVPRDVGVDTNDILILDDGTALRVQQSNRYPAQGKVIARQVVGQVLASDPYLVA